MILGSRNFWISRVWMLSFLFTAVEYLHISKACSFFLSRERQDADGQMKELQDQLEAEQYFSVCFMLLYFYINLFIEYISFFCSPSAIRHFTSLAQSYLIFLFLSPMLSAALILITDQHKRAHVEKCPSFAVEFRGRSQAAHFFTMWIIFCMFQASCIQHLFHAVWQGRVVFSRDVTKHVHLRLRRKFCITTKLGSDLLGGFHL